MASTPENTELQDAIRLCQFQSDALRDLCAPALAPLLSGVEQLADELACLAKWCSTCGGGEGSGRPAAAALLSQAVGLLNALLLLHGDLRGLPSLFCTRLCVLQLEQAKATLRQALECWLPASATQAAQLRLQLCLALAGALSLGDTSTREELASAVLSRLVALAHGCRYPHRSVARALQLLAACCQVAAETPAGGSGGGTAAAGGDTEAAAAAAPATVEMDAAQLLEQLAGVAAAVHKLLRAGHEIDAFHLQLLAVFLEEHCAGEGEGSGQEPPGKRSRHSTAGAAQADPPPGPPAGWRPRADAARRTLGHLHFRHFAEPLATGSNRLQQYAALLALAEIFRGHIGPAEAAGGDATWVVTCVAAGAAAAAGLQPLLLQLEARLAEGDAPAALPAAPPAAVGSGSVGSPEQQVLSALVADALAHLSMPAAGGAAGPQPGPAAPAALSQQAVLERGLQLLQAPDCTSRRLGCNVVSLYAQLLAHRGALPTPSPDVGASTAAAGSSTAQLGPGSAATPAVALERGPWLVSGQGVGLDADGWASPPAPAVGGEREGTEPGGVREAQRPAADAEVQAAVAAYSALPGLDEGLAELLRAEGIRCRLSALGAVYRIAALRPGLFPRCARCVAPLLNDPHPEAQLLRVSLVAAATLARLAGVGALRARLQQEGAPQALLRMLSRMASEGAGAGGDGELRDEAKWAASEGLAALARLTQPSPALQPSVQPRAVATSAAAAAAGSNDAGATAESAARLHQFAQELLALGCTEAALALRKVQDADPASLMGC